MRGRDLFNSLHDSGDDDGGDERSSGRNKDLLKRRDERMCDRLYYLQMDGRRYELIAKQLEEEFDISAARIADIITSDEWSRYLKQLKNEKADRIFFRKKWKWMVWD